MISKMTHLLIFLSSFLIHFSLSSIQNNKAGYKTLLINIVRYASQKFKCNWTISYVPVHLAKGNGDALK